MMCKPSENGSINYGVFLAFCYKWAEQFFCYEGNKYILKMTMGLSKHVVGRIHHPNECFVFLQHGIIECQYIKCPELQCNRSSQIQLKGQCCPRCAGWLPGCVDYHGFLHNFGERFGDPEDPCVDCLCDVSCKLKSKFQLL